MITSCVRSRPNTNEHRPAPAQAAPDDGFGMQRNFGWLAYRPGLGSEEEGDPLAFCKQHKKDARSPLMDPKSHMVAHDLVVNAARLQEELHQLKQGAFHGLPSLITPDDKHPPPELLQSQMAALKRGLQNYSQLFPNGVPASFQDPTSSMSLTLQPRDLAADDELRDASPQSTKLDPFTAQKREQRTPTSQLSAHIY